MQQEYLLRILNEVKNHTLPVEKAIEQLRLLPFEELRGEVHLDHHRSLRSGFPEVVFAQGKTPSQIVEIFHKLAQANNQVLVTRLDERYMSRFGQSSYPKRGMILKAAP
jgi:NCAIR mutase (PurE)-related protein